MRKLNVFYYEKNQGTPKPQYGAVDVTSACLLQAKSI